MLPRVQAKVAHQPNGSGIFLSGSGVGSAPAVSVLLPVRNGRQTLRRALGDLAAGLSADDELLVIDDGSDDGTPLILKDLVRSVTQLRVIRTPGTGLVAALNLGLRETRHRLIARADADDRYPKDRLTHQRDAWAEGVVLVSGDYRAMAEGRVLGEFPTAISHPFVAASLVHPQRIPHPGVLLDRHAVIEAGGYRKEDFPAEDLALWLRLSKIGRMGGVPTVTVNWSMSRGSISHASQTTQRRKTQQMLATGLARELICAISGTDVHRELQRYRGTRLESMRRLLLVRDLGALRDLGLSEDAYRESVKSVLRHPVGSMAAGGRIAKEKWLRDKLRQGFADSS